jgi:hypothetical protein
LLLTSVPADVPIMVREAEGLEPSMQAHLAHTLAAAIQAETGRRAFLDDFGVAIDELRARTGAASILVVSIVAGARLLRLTVERSDTGAPPRRVQVDIDEVDSAWTPTFRGVARALFPLELPAAHAVAEAIRPPPEPSSVGPALAWISVGAGAAAIAAAIVLRVLAEAKASDAEQAAQMAMPDVPAIEALAADGARFGAASNIGFGSGAVLVTGGVVYLLASP